MISDEDLVIGCQASNRSAQKILYSRYAGKMKGVCIRYTSNREDAKDVLQEGFIKVFSKIDTYSGKGSLEGWIKRIIINTALTQYKRNKSEHFFEDINDPKYIEAVGESESEDAIFEDNFSKEELLNALASIPEVFKVVFNLYYIEEQSHKDIAELLSIDEKTSRTRLYRARKLLQEHLKKVMIKKTLV